IGPTVAMKSLSGGNSMLPTVIPRRVKGLETKGVTVVLHQLQQLLQRLTLAIHGDALPQAEPGSGSRSKANRLQP
ncbi:hypothetical protein, partial [Pseudomonas sp. NMI795_08]|uniref:hypothetical protein n=1 Tax=Pseudomonas sp. NMI795_08 TaxID=2903144 RepID=UPI001E519C0D